LVIVIVSEREQDEFLSLVLLKAGVFNLSDSAGHINNFNDARGPQSHA
jgi:hypothetical protein